MTMYKPQPGTIPHRAVAWLRAMQAERPGYEPSTVEFCEALDVDTYAFTACMRMVRERGLVHTRKESPKVLRWKLGSGKPDPELTKPAHLASFDASVEGKVPAKVRQKTVPASEFRALMWDGQLLATGMEIRDGVAIFTPEQVLTLKQHTDWVRPE
jgi:hypothetical protein